MTSRRGVRDRVHVHPLTIHTGALRALLSVTRVQNSAPAAPAGAVGQQAVALRLSGDKTMLYRCRILGTQDTLFDNIGRHFLYNCDIQGSIDFIFGNARSLYQVRKFLSFLPLTCSI